jgi:hypothetical protein
MTPARGKQVEEPETGMTPARGSQVEEPAAAAEGGRGGREVPVPAAAVPCSPQGAGPEAILGGADLQARPRGHAAGPDAGGEPGQIHPPLSCTVRIKPAEKGRLGREKQERRQGLREWSAHGRMEACHGRSAEEEGGRGPGLIPFLRQDCARGEWEARGRRAHLTRCHGATCH